MPTTTEASKLDAGSAARVESLCLDLRDFLGGVKKSLDDEIGAYPKPIPRCDAQFNHLYEQRARLSLIRARVDAMSAGRGDPDELVDALAEFAAFAPLTEDAAEQALRGRIRAEFAKRNRAFIPDPNQRVSDRPDGAG